MYQPLTIDESFLVPEVEAAKPAPAVPDTPTPVTEEDVLWTLKKWDLIECQGIFSVEENIRRTPLPQSDSVVAVGGPQPVEEESTVAMGRITINGKKAVLLLPDGLSVEGDVVQLKKPLVLLRRTQVENDAPTASLDPAAEGVASRKRGRVEEVDDSNEADDNTASSGFLITEDTPFDVLRSSGREHDQEASATGETFFGPEYTVVGVVERKYYFKSKPIRTSKR